MAAWSFRSFIWTRFFGLFRDGGQEFGEIAGRVVKTLKSPVWGYLQGFCLKKDLTQDREFLSDISGLLEGAF